MGNISVDSQRNNVDAQPPTRRLPGSPAAGGSGQPNPSSNPNIQSTTLGWEGGSWGANSAPASRRNAAQAAVAECEGLWDKETHMIKDQMAATCPRIQNRLNDVAPPW